MTLADGFAATAVYNGVWLGDASLDPIWATLNESHATVFVHPDAYVALSKGWPAPLIEVAFDTTKTVVDMIYKGIFSNFPKIRFVIAHARGYVPILSDRLALLRTKS
jgi:predicted TIM-barrel fold metal-dependent hydrolase